MPAALPNGCLCNIRATQTPSLHTLAFFVAAVARVLAHHQHVAGIRLWVTWLGTTGRLLRFEIILIEFVLQGVIQSPWLGDRELKAKETNNPTTTEASSNLFVCLKAKRCFDQPTAKPAMFRAI